MCRPAPQPGQPDTTVFDLDAAGEALDELEGGRILGTAVLRVR